MEEPSRPAVGVRETRFIQKDGGPFVEGSVYYESPDVDRFGASVTQSFRRPVYTAGRIEKRLATMANAGLRRVAVHPHGLSGPNRFPAELWERRRDSDMKAAFDQLRASKRFGFKFSHDEAMPPLVRSDIVTERPWPIRTWIASTFLDRAKQVVSESMRTGIVVRKDRRAADYEDPSTASLPSLTVIFKALMEARIGATPNDGDGDGDDRHRLTFHAGIHFVNMIDILVSYTSVFVEVKKKKKGKPERAPRNMDDDEWYDKSDMQDAIDRIAEQVVGDQFSFTDRGASLAAVVARELERYPAHTDDRLVWANALNDVHVATEEQEMTLLQKWIYFAELTAFFRAVTSDDVENLQTYRDLVEGMEAAAADLLAPAAFEPSRFIASAATTLAPIDYLEAQIMTTVMLFYQHIWAKPRLWESTNRILLASDDFYLPGYRNQGHSLAPQYTGHRKRILGEVANLSEILLDLAASVPEVMTADYAEKLHVARGALFEDHAEASYLDTLKDPVPLKIVEKKATQSGGSNFYCKVLMNSEWIRFWTPFPEAQPFTLQPLGWNREAGGKNVPWPAWQAPAGNVIRALNQGKSYDDAQPLAVMSFHRVQEAFSNSTTGALDLLHTVVLEYITAPLLPIAIGSDEEDAEGAEVVVISPPRRIFDHGRVLAPSVEGLLGIDSGEAPKSRALQKLSDTMEALLSSRHAWVRSLHRRDPVEYEARQSHLVNRLYAAYASLYNNALGKHSEEPQEWVMEDDHESRIRYRPIGKTRGKVLKRQQRLRVYRLVESWFSDYASTAHMMLSALAADNFFDALGQADPQPNQTRYTRLLSGVTELSRLFTSNRTFTVQKPSVLAY